MINSGRGYWTLIGLTLALVGPGILALMSKGIESHPQRFILSIVSLSLFILLVTSVVWVALRKENLTFRQLGFNNMTWRTFVGAFLLAAFFIFIYGPVIYIVLHQTGIGDFSSGMNSLQQLPVWYLFVTVILVAGGEEWLYRAYAIERLEHLTGNPILAGTISLFAFFVVHLPFWGLGAAATTLVSGAILTMLYIWKRDILMLILAHVGTDLYGLVVNV